MPRGLYKGRPLAVWLPAGFVIAVLITLILWPVLIGRQIAVVRKQIDADSLTALEDVQQVRRVFLSEISDLLYWRITRESQYLLEYSKHLTEAHDHLRDLQQKAAALGQRVGGSYLDVARSLKDWEEQITPRTYSNSATDRLDRTLLRQNILVQSVHDNLDNLESAIDMEVENQQGTIYRLERREAIGIFVLSALALMAVMAIMIIGRRLNRALSDAQSATTARDEVLRIVSHDLRNPLSLVSIASSQLVDGTLAEDKRNEMVAMIRRAADRMNRMIEALLEVGKAQSGRPLVLNAEEHDLGAILQEACSLAQFDAARKAIELVSAEHASFSIFADREKILQVLSNLIGNAIKFTPENGRIVIRSAKSGEEVCISVSDSGPGIPEADQNKIFDPYWQAQRTAHLGTGLGLAIAQRIVQDHGGRIWVDSRVGNGSTFYFTLPADGHAFGRSDEVS